MQDDDDLAREPNTLEGEAGRAAPASRRGARGRGGAEGGCSCARSRSRSRCGAEASSISNGFSGMPVGAVVPIFTRRSFDFSSLVPFATLEIPFVRAQPVVGYGDALMRLRVHSASIPSSAWIKLTARVVAPSTDEPQTDFLGVQVGDVTIDETTSVPSLQSVTLSPEFGSHIQLVLSAQRDAGTFSAVLSADLVLREASVEPAFLWHHTLHSHTKTDNADLVYVPFVSNVESAAIGDNAPSIRMVSQHDGWLERIVAYATANAGSTTIGLHLNNDSTPSIAVTSTMGAHSAVVYPFGGRARFARGDLLSLSFDPSSVADYVNLHCEWVFRRGT